LQAQGTQTRRRAGGGDSLSPLTGAEGGRAALAPEPEPDGTRGGEPAAAAAVAVAKRAQAGLHSVVLIRQQSERDKAEAKRAGVLGWASWAFGPNCFVLL